MKGKEIATLTVNVMAILSVEVTIVLGLDSGKTTTIVADNPKEMRASIAEQTVSALVFLFVAIMTTNAGKNVQALDVAVKT